MTVPSTEQPAAVREFACRLGRLLPERGDVALWGAQSGGGVVEQATSSTVPRIREGGSQLPASRRAVERRCRGVHPDGSLPVGELMLGSDAIPRFDHAATSYAHRIPFRLSG
jgi:hypothetical protein